MGKLLKSSYIVCQKMFLGLRSLHSLANLSRPNHFSGSRLQNEYLDHYIIKLVTYALYIIGLSNCSTGRVKPCTHAGQPARDPGVVFEGTKSCMQITNEEGRVVNHGKYYELYPDDHLALTGEYKNGKKTGRWIEYDQNGNHISDKHFEEGKEVPTL